MADFATSVEELTPRQQALRHLAEERSRRKSGRARNALTSVGRTVGEPFNRQIVNTLSLPTDALNLGLQGMQKVGGAVQSALGTENQAFNQPAPQLPNSLLQAAQQMGFTAPPGEQAQGFIPRTAELLGGSVIPGGTLLQLGKQALKTLPAFRTGVQNVTAQAARSPGIVATADVVSSATSAFGGEVARGFTDDPTIIALAEVGGAFSLPLAAKTISVLPGFNAVRTATLKTVVPFTKAGAEPRAAKRLQSLSSDPKGDAAKISTDVGVGFSPARQTGDARLIALERRILDADPEMAAQFSNDLKVARAELLRGIDLGGDPEAGRKLLEVAAAQAGQAAQIEIAALGVTATPRQISDITRRNLEKALGRARTVEGVLWKALDQTAVGSTTRSKQALLDELATRSRFDDPADIPPWLREGLLEDQLPKKVMQGLAKKGLLGPDGEIPPSILAALQAQGVVKQTTMGDLQSLRSRTLQAIRDENGNTTKAPNRNKVRILGDIEEALLADMTDINVPGADGARAFSRLLNERFTRGSVGRVLGRDRRGSLKVSPEDTLDNIVYGRSAATSIREVIAADQGARQQIEGFFKASYFDSVVDKVGIDRAAHTRFVSGLEKRGIFDIFPDLKTQLSQIKSADDAARILQVRDTPITRLSGVEKASLYLNAPAGEEMKFLLRSNQSVLVAESLVARMDGNQKAIQGLKTSFMHELSLQASSGGSEAVNGGKLKNLLATHRDVAKALRFTDDDFARVDDIASRLVRAEASPELNLVQEILDDNPAVLLDLAARWSGARSTAKLADNMGSQLVLAQFGSSRFRKLLGRLTNDTARELLVAAQTDPRLYRSLLVKSTDTIPQQEAAAAILSPWILGTVTETGALASSIRLEGD